MKFYTIKKLGVSPKIWFLHSSSKFMIMKYSLLIFLSIPLLGHGQSIRDIVYSQKFNTLTIVNGFENTYDTRFPRPQSVIDYESKVLNMPSEEIEDLHKKAIDLAIKKYNDYWQLWNIHYGEYDSKIWSEKCLSFIAVMLLQNIITTSSSMEVKLWGTGTPYPTKNSYYKHLSDEALKETMQQQNQFLRSSSSEQH